MTAADAVLVVVVIVRHMIFTPDATPFDWARRKEDSGRDRNIPELTQNLFFDPAK
jgi:hypothetical protein